MSLWKTLSPRRAFRAPPLIKRFRPSVVALEDRTVPAADLFADATLLSGALLSATGSNAGASGESGEVAPSTVVGSEPINSVWWKWTAPVDSRVEVNTLG